MIIYLSDFAVILYLAMFFFENRFKLKQIYKEHNAFVKTIAVFGVYLLVDSIVFSVSRQASLIFATRATVFSVFALAAAVTLSRSEIVKKSATLFKNLIEAEALILIAQFLLQRSLGLTFLGERTFDTTTSSIAHANLFGNQVLRSYGTFPHPNVAAAFLVFGMTVFLGSKRETIKFVFPSALALVGLFVTFSKSALAAFAVTLGIIFAKRKEFLLFIVAFLAIGALLLKNTSDASLPTISERLVLIQKSLDISLESPIFGIGSNNFILELSKSNLFSVNLIRLLQPVHNIFFLILAENGVLGLLLFFAILFTVLKRADTKIKLALFVSILIFGSIDHFLWTLQQGQLLLWLSVGYILSSQKSRAS
ncbi:MAG: O-antigen ligase family protein [Candidatus Curtissbacteria bacterium]